MQISGAEGFIIRSRATMTNPVALILPAYGPVVTAVRLALQDTYGTVAAMEETKANYVRSRSAGEAFSGEQEGDLGRVMGGQNRIVMVFGPDS